MRGPQTAADVERSAAFCKTLQVNTTNEYLTTRELADLLRIKERKVYDLAASGEVPCSKAMGKLLFPRKEVDAWLAGSSTGPSAQPLPERPNVFLGSHDPLLDWALRESRSGIATFFDGSVDGLDRFAKREGLAAGLHLFDDTTNTWNVTQVTARFEREDVVLVEWAGRRRGLIVRPDEEDIFGVRDLQGRRVAPRQAEAGSQLLFERMLAAAGLKPTDIACTAPARSESDAALAVLESKADAAFGLAALADQYRLSFIPVITERFDLLVDRRAWFEEPMQTFLNFCRSEEFSAKAESLQGYDLADFGRVHFNA